MLINCWLAEIDHSCNCCNTSWHHPKSWFLIAMLFLRSYVIYHINHKLFIKFILIRHQRITCISFSLRVISYSLQSTFRLTLHAAWLQVFLEKFEFWQFGRIWIILFLSRAFHLKVKIAILPSVSLVKLSLNMSLKSESFHFPNHTVLWKWKFLSSSLVKVNVYLATQEVLWRHLHFSSSSSSPSLHTRLMSPLQHWEWLWKKFSLQIHLISDGFPFFTWSICCHVLLFPLAFSPLNLLSCTPGPSYLGDKYPHVL